MDWAKKLSGEAVREFISGLVWSYWPLWGAPVVTAILGWIGGYPAFEIFLGLLAAFALVALALNNVSTWISTRTPADKVSIAVPFIGVKPGSSKTSRIEGLKLGVALHNRAPFPVEARIDILETQVGDRVPSDAFYQRSIVISPGQGAQLSNSLIDLSNMKLAEELIYAHIKAKISYGRPGKLKYSAEQTYYLALKFDKNGQVAGIEQSTTQII